MQPLVLPMALIAIRCVVCASSNSADMSSAPLAHGDRTCRRALQFWPALVFSIALWIAVSEPLRVHAAAQLPPSEVCLSTNQNLTLGAPLPRAAARLRMGGRFGIVAIGSSSTVGLWVLNPATTYPEVMRRELMRLRPKSLIEAVNSGRIGDTIAGSVSRFNRDVLSHNPDLVVWQLGTNDVVWGGSTHGLEVSIGEGIKTLKANGADVVLMDLQYSPLVLSSSNGLSMQTMIAGAARQARIGLFSRFDLMRRSVDAGLSPGALVSWDGLHNSADGYDCIGRALARSVDAAVR